MTEVSAQLLFARWRAQVVAALGEAREELDALNVYPVPDADTGTNVYLTVEAAGAAAEKAEAASAGLAEIGTAYVDGALRGARGNSGVILSQILRAAVPLLLQTHPTDDPVAAGKVFAEVLRAGADAAWAAVGDPVEGTILSVARAAADAGTEATEASDGASLTVVLRAVTTAARAALERTPDQLALLREAGVVDAGGGALVVVLDTTERVLTGRVDARAWAPRRALPVPVPTGSDDRSYTGPGFEVMYLLDAPDEAIPGLRAALAPLGDSLVVVGGGGLWNVHIHVDDAGAAVEAGIAVGRPHRVAITHLGPRESAPADTSREHAAQPRQSSPDSPGRSVVICAAGPGLADLFARAGAVVVDTTGGRHPLAGELFEAILVCGAPEVVVLPNDRDVVSAAEAAARQVRDQGVRVAVIPTRTQVQGLAALAVHDPGRGFDDDVVQMGAAAGHTRHGAVTVATQRAMTMAGPCEPGDVLGVVDGDFAIVGDDLGQVAIAVVERLLGGSGELVTLVSGADAPADLMQQVERWVTKARPEVDVEVHEGGQTGYPLLVAVE